MSKPFLKRLAAICAAATLCSTIGVAHAEDPNWPSDEYAPGDYPSISDVTANYTDQTNPRFYEFYRFNNILRIITPWPGNPVRCSGFRWYTSACWQLDNKGVGHKLKDLSSLNVFVVDGPNTTELTDLGDSPAELTTNLTALALRLPMGSVDVKALDGSSTGSTDTQSTSGSYGSTSPGSSAQVPAEFIYTHVPQQKTLISNYLNELMGTQLTQD